MMPMQGDSARGAEARRRSAGRKTADGSGFGKAVTYNQERGHLQQRDITEDALAP